VGNEVKEAFLAVAAPANVLDIEAAFKRSATSGKWFADLYRLARIRLLAAGLSRISGEPACTFCNSDTWYSYRHHPQTGRFATLIVKTG
jgi:copper oxidase (laccase) domain-containing protein